LRVYSRLPIYYRLGMITSEQVKKLAAARGFDLCGITTPELIPEARRRYVRYLEDGLHGEMTYLAREVARRTDASGLMENARSVIMLGLNYFQPNAQKVPADYGRISRYARGRDYHKVVSNKTRALIRSIESVLGTTEPFEFKWFVDYGPMMERAYAEKAGLGFIGRNGMLINREFGSWVFLSEIITSLDLQPDVPDPTAHGDCGDCRLCAQACPTGAIVAPRVIDSRRCISYLTVEKPSSVSDDLAGRMGSLVFGCDICQEVCPYNRAATVTRHAELLSARGMGEFLDLKAVMRMQTREDFLQLTAGTALTRPKLEGLKRSAGIVLKNQVERT